MLTAATSAALLLASPFGGATGASIESPVVVPGAPASVVWSGTSPAAPTERELYVQSLSQEVATGPPVRLTHAGRDGDPEAAAVVPGALRRRDGGLLVAYSERRRVGPRIERRIRVQATAPKGTPIAPVRAASGTVTMRGRGRGNDAAPALAWSADRRWALVAWVEKTESGGRVRARRLEPGGRPRGRVIELARLRDGWSSAAPRVATASGGVVVAWADGRAGADAFRAVRIGRRGVKPVRLGLDVRRERRVLGATAGRASRYGVALLARPDGRPIVAWNVIGPPDPDGLEPASAVLGARLGDPSSLRALSDVEGEFPVSTFGVALTDDGDGIAASWLLVDDAISSRGGALNQVLARRFTGRLAPRGPVLPLSTSDDPAGPAYVDSANGVDRPRSPGSASLGRAGGTLVAAWPRSPFLVGRVVP